MAVARLQPTAASEEFGADGALFELIKRRSFRRGSFILSSGEPSDHYFDLKPTMMDPHGAALAARAFLERTSAAGVEYIGGLEMGAVPILGGLAVLSHLEDKAIQTFFVRKVPKGHGTKKLVEGLTEDESLVGKKVWIADDVATKGASIMQAVDAVRAQGATVDTALVLLDREEGAESLLLTNGVRLLSVFRASQFLSA